LCFDRRVGNRQPKLFPVSQVPEETRGVGPPPRFAAREDGLKRRRSRIAARFLALALLIAYGLSDAQCVPTSSSPKVETFATIKVIAGQGEAGSELRLQELGSHVTARLRDYLGGGKLMETRLTGALTETKNGTCRVRLSGRNKDGPIEIDGEILISRFQGTATRHVGKEVLTQTISLRRQLPGGVPAVGHQLDDLPAPHDFKQNKEAFACASY
jgi:hypothetical protein